MKVLAVGVADVVELEDDAVLPNENNELELEGNVEPVVAIPVEDGAPKFNEELVGMFGAPNGELVLPNVNEEGAIGLNIDTAGAGAATSLFGSDAGRTK